MMANRISRQMSSPKARSLNCCQGMMAPKYTKYEMLRIRSRTVDASESAVFTATHPSQANAHPAANDASKSSAPRVEQKPAHMTARMK